MDGRNQFVDWSYSMGSNLREYLILSHHMELKMGAIWKQAREVCDGKKSQEVQYTRENISTRYN
jgi:hypothetical protein